MEITKENYEALLPSILKQIQDATFVSFDAEFSGLGNPTGETTSLFDTGAYRYDKIRKIVMHNTCPQIGFCLFRKEDGEANVFHVEGYQAYVTQPRFAEFNQKESVLSLEYKCGKFLRQCGFSFNAFVEKAVPYLNDSKMRKLRQYLDKTPDFMQKHSDRYFDKTLFPSKKNSYDDDQERKELLQRLRGISQIVDVIKSHKIPVVGHNIMLDIMYFFDMFCDDLPEDYETFKKAVGTYIPHVYDTKFMILSCKNTLQSHPAYKANQDKDKLESSSLFVAFRNTSNFNDKFAPKLNLGRSCLRFETNLGERSDSLAHTPAFDACITGNLFLNMSHIAARIDKNFHNRMISPTKSELFENVQSWKNQIFISRAAILSIYLEGNDPKPCRPRWVEAILKSKQKIPFDSLKSELEKLGPVDIELVDDYTLLFAASGGKNARLIKKLLQGTGYSIRNVNIPYDKSKNTVSGELEKDDV